MKFSNKLWISSIITNLNKYINRHHNKFKLLHKPKIKDMFNINNNNL